MALAATARALRRGHRCAAPAAFALLHLVALACFVRGFLLTRVHLTERAAATSPDAAAKAPYDRVVWLMIDALRYDFVVADGRYRCPEGSSKDGSGVRPTCHQGHMPFLTELGASPVRVRLQELVLPCWLCPRLQPASHAAAAHCISLAFSLSSCRPPAASCL